MTSEIVLLVITAGSFVASFVNAAFATGGVFILIASSSAVLPLAAAVPLQAVFAASSLAARMFYFREHIRWPIVGAFGAGAVIGVGLGVRIFVSLSEAMIATLLGGLLLILIWAPAPRVRIALKHPFFLVGIAHSFISSLFGVGAILQSIILRTRLTKLEITSTAAGCMLAMDCVKLIGYTWFGFDYLDYLPHILLATLAGFAGTWAGKRVTHLISERAFRAVFKALITLVALRLLYKGLAA